MPADLRRAYVVDVESTCWETREEQGDQPSEIIEIGICAINLLTFNISEKASYLIKPRFTAVSPFCTELTGWTQDDVDGAGDISDALAQIQADYHMKPNQIWMSWGGYDKRKLSSDPWMVGGVHQLYGIERDANPFAKFSDHINVKQLMALRERQEEMGMERALKFYRETLEGRHHNGADDAYNIAKLVRRVLS